MPATNINRRKRTTLLLLGGAAGGALLLLLVHPAVPRAGNAAWSAAAGSGKGFGFGTALPEAPRVRDGRTLHQRAVGSADLRATGRAEAVRRIVARFRRRQVAAELRLEQERYGPHYWDSEATGPEIRSLELRRSRLLQELNAALAAALPPGGNGDTIALTALFGEARGGPRLDFLDAAAQARVEDLLAAAPDLAADRPALLDRVRDLLAPDQRAQFQDWNAPESALLRRQLVGFGASQVEFDAIARWPDFVNQGNAGLAEDAPAESRLADEIGVARVADLIRLRDPEVETAVQDLHRLGLPVDRAEWLAAMRGEATSRMQQVWADGALTADAKETRVEALRVAYATQLASALAPGRAIDQAGLLP